MTKSDRIASVEEYFIRGFQRLDNGTPMPRIGAELKFPLVDLDGGSVERAMVDRLFAFLVDRGWRSEVDPKTGRIVSARKAGEFNDTVAACETGFSKIEFAMAHVGNLHDLAEQIEALRVEVQAFADQNEVRFLAFGVHPLTPPGRQLLRKVGRAVIWDKLLTSNRHIPSERGHDGHLFTINAGSHVHLSIQRFHAPEVVDVLNGFAGAMIALTAHSNVWQGQLDTRFKSVSECFWDWWRPAARRVGVPDRPFRTLRRYIRDVSELRLLYVHRRGRPLIVREPLSFAEFTTRDEVPGIDPNGTETTIVPEPGDIRLHNSCYWYNARISRHFTVENRVFDAQPPDAMLVPAALTLGLASARHEAQEELEIYDWAELRDARTVACRTGLQGRAGSIVLAEFARQLVDLAVLGLSRRQLDEERYLEPLLQRLESRRCPADDTEIILRAQGIPGLVEARAF